MKVELKTQKGVQTRWSSEVVSGTEYQVVLMAQGQEVVVDRYLSPGSYLDGFLSDTQAKVRASESMQRIKKFLADIGNLDSVVEPGERPVVRKGARPPRDTNHRSGASGLLEDRSFAPRLRA